MSKPEDGKDSSSPIPGDLDKLEETLREIFGKETKDVVIRRLSLPTKPELDALLLFIEGLVDRDTMNLAALKSLMLSNRAAHLDFQALNPDNAAKVVMDEVLNINQVAVYGQLEQVYERVMVGEAALFLAGANECVVFEAKGFSFRQVSEPGTEKAIRGPREGFTEVLRVNTSLVRRRIRTTALRLDSMTVGRVSRTDVAIAYIEGLTNPRFVSEIKKRIGAVDTDIIPDSGFLEEFIEDYPYSPFPQVHYTERPDKFAACLSEGQIGIIVDGSPLGLLAPANLATFFQSPDDYYERAAFGGPLRLLRYVAGAIALLLPSLYVAISTFHPEMLPTKLALAFAGARAPVPFPAWVEALLMEIALELIREAGLRLPNPVGQTVGFIGALLLGEAAVRAGIVSPIMVIVVATTGLASFAIPHYPTGLAVRLLRFPLLFLAAGLGLFGVMSGLLAIALHLGALTSLGTAYLESLMHPKESLRDVLWRAPVFMFGHRPSYTEPVNQKRQKPFIRSWSGGVAKRAEEQETEDQEDERT